MKRAPKAWRCTRTTNQGMMIVVYIYIYYYYSFSCPTISILTIVLSLIIKGSKMIMIWIIATIVIHGQQKIINSLWHYGLNYCNWLLYQPTSNMTMMDQELDYQSSKINYSNDDNVVRSLSTTTRKQKAVARTWNDGRLHILFPSRSFSFSLCLVCLSTSNTEGQELSSQYCIVLYCIIVMSSSLIASTTKTLTHSTKLY